MAFELQYLTFIVSCLAFVEQRLTAWVVYLYYVVRCRVPSLCVPLAVKFETGTGTLYSRLRSWLCEKGKPLLLFADDMLGGSIAWVEERFPSLDVVERFTKVRRFWAAMAARISEIWKKHGIIVGTFVVMVAVWYAILELVGKVLEWPLVKAAMSTVGQSWLVRKTLFYFNAKVLPPIAIVIERAAETVQKTRVALSGPMNSVIEWISTLIDNIVGTVYYAKCFDATIAVVNKVRATEVYQKIEKTIEPYITPTLKNVQETDLYINMVDKLTPVKEE